MITSTTTANNIPTYRRRSVCQTPRPHRWHTYAYQPAASTMIRSPGRPTLLIRSRTVRTTYHRATAERRGTVNHSDRRPGNVAETRRTTGRAAPDPPQRPAAVGRAGSSRSSPGMGRRSQDPREQPERRRIRTPAASWAKAWRSLPPRLDLNRNYEIQQRHWTTRDPCP